MTHTIKTLVKGLTFTEGPRWKDNKLYFSDFFTHRVLAVDLQGNLETVVELNDQPSGLGWTPQGDLLIVSMVERKLLKFDDTAVTEVADLSPYASWHCNDMVVSNDGTAYIGNFGCDFENEDLVPANLIKVTFDSKNDKIEVSVAAGNMIFPNGSVITDNGKTLIVAESFAFRLTAFDIDTNGDLSNRRVWAPLEGYAPDGICMDAAGGIWVAPPGTKSVIRVEEGGKLTDKIDLELECIACALGSEPGSKQMDKLLLCVSEHVGSEDCKQRPNAGIMVVDLAQ